MKTRNSIVAAVIAVLGSIATGPAVAAYPEKTLNYIIAFGPGGESDVSARLQEPFFRKYTGQTIAIQYKPGAGGAATWAQLNGMPADGYTIVGVNIPHIILQPYQKDVGYETADLAVVYWFHYTPDAIMVTADSPYKTLKDLVDAAKKAPGTVTFSGSGTNSANHLAQQLFDKLAGIKTTYVPFKGTGASNTALLGKQVSGSWGYTTVQMMLGEKARCLAVALEKRHPRIPACPTLKELGYNMVGGAYRGIAVPKSTPDNVKQALSELIGKINKDPEFIAKMEENGFAMLDVGMAGMPKFTEDTRTLYYGLAQDMGIPKRK